MGFGALIFCEARKYHFIHRWWRRIGTRSFDVYGFDPFEINMLEIVYKRMQEGANKKKSDDDDDKNEGEEDEAEVHA